MNRKVLIKVFLMFSMCGLFLLILIGEFSELERVNVVELEDKIEQRVVVSGQVGRITQKPEVNFLELRDDTGEIDVVAFGEMKRLADDSEVEVRGKVALYKGELEIIADEITIL